MDLILKILMGFVIVLIVFLMIFGIIVAIWVLEARIDIYKRKKKIKAYLAKCLPKSSMPINEIIETLQNAISEVKWNYPIKYVVALESAIEILKEIQEAKNRKEWKS